MIYCCENYTIISDVFDTTAIVRMRLLPPFKLIISTTQGLGSTSLGWDLHYASDGPLRDSVVKPAVISASGLAFLIPSLVCVLSFHTYILIILLRLHMRTGWLLVTVDWFQGLFYSSSSLSSYCVASTIYALNSVCNFFITRRWYA